MIFIESDDGEPYDEYRYVSYTQDSTGLVQNYQFNFTCYNLDTIMSEMTYPRETILEIDLNGEDVWWKEDAVKWTYTRKYRLYEKDNIYYNLIDSFICRIRSKDKR